MASPLADLDELVLKCRDERSRSYVAEAVASYHAGAFRSAIVAAWIAVCFDYFDKLRELALSGDAEAERQLTDIDQARSLGDIARVLRFEKDLLDVARDKFELISQLEYLDLKRLQEDRNRCAHPSLVSDEQVYVPAAELARLHIHSAVTHLLQHAPAQGRYALERVMKDIDSEYFPTKVVDAAASLAHGPLRRPRESLIRNVVVVLVKQLVRGDFDWRARGRYSAALNAIATLQQAAYSHALSAKLSPILRSVDDADLYEVVRLLQYVPDCWRFADSDVQQRVKTFVANLPEAWLDHLESVLTIDALRESAESRIRRMTRAELGELSFLDAPDQVMERFVEVYLASSSFAEANKWAHQLHLHATDLSAARLRELVAGMGVNNQVRESFEIGPLLTRLRKLARIPVAEFDQLLEVNGLSQIVDSTEAV